MARSFFGLELRRFSSATVADHLPSGGGQVTLCAYAERFGAWPAADADRRPGELPAGRRQRGCARSPASVDGRRRRDPGREGVLNQDQAITLFIGVVMLVGVAGAVLPWFPDLLLIWGAGLAYGLLVGWGTWGPWLFALMTLTGLAALAAEVGLISAGARVGGPAGWGGRPGGVRGRLGVFVV